MSSSPRFSRKETRALAQEAESAGFVYAGDDSKGHARYVLPAPCARHQTPMCDKLVCSISLAETPASGQLKAVRDKIRRLTGHGTRGSRNANAARERQKKERDKFTTVQRRIEREEDERRTAEQQRLAKRAAWVRARSAVLAHEHLERNGMTPTLERIELQRPRFVTQALRESDRNPYLRDNDEHASSRAQMRTRANISNKVVKGRIKPKAGGAIRLANTPAVTDDDDYLTAITPAESERLARRNADIINKANAYAAA